MKNIEIKTHPLPLGPVAKIEENINILIIISYNLSTNTQKCKIAWHSKGDMEGNKGL